MHESKILHIDDHARFRRKVAAFLDVSGEHFHRVVSGAADPRSAQQQLEAIADGTLDIDVIILGNLADHTNGHNILEVAARIRALGLPLKTIGLGSQAMAAYGVEVDIDVSKDRFRIDRLEQALNRLTEPTG